MLSPVGCFQPFRSQALIYLLMRKKVFVFAGHFFWCFAARALGLFLFLSELCMKFFANRAMSSKVVTICVAVVLVTGTHIMLRPAQAFAVEPTFII